jgi:IS1 family transposase
LWSCVGNKDNKQWVLLAIDRETREIVGVHIGRRDAEAAKALWASLPQVYQDSAVSYTEPISGMRMKRRSRLIATTR